MYGTFKDHLQKQIDSIIHEGLYKKERILTTPQGVEIKTVHGQKGTARSMEESGSRRTGPSG